MDRYDREARILAIGLTALSGYVDAVGYIAVGGLFVSFMSGNSTQMAVGFVEGLPMAWTAAALIADFVSGVIAASLLSHVAGRRRHPAVLGLVSVLLAGAALAGSVSARSVAIGLMVFAMGAENTVFQRGGTVSIGVSYVTGTLVKFGQTLSAALLGRGGLAWLPHFLMWLGLALGAAAGAALYRPMGLHALWLAATAAALLALVSLRTPPERDAEDE